MFNYNQKFRVMKKLIFSLASVAAISLAMTACEPDYLGTNAGGDAEPAVTVYTFEPELPYSADNDLKVRVMANNQTSQVYILAGKVGTELSADRVVAEGTKYDVTLQQDGSYSFDAYLTNMQGDYVIAVVGVNGSNQSAVKTASFKGLIWKDICSGTYTFNGKVAALGQPASTETTLQKCENVDQLYRFTNLFGEGYPLKFYGTGMKDKDDDGTFEFITVAANKTPYLHATYGEVNARDVYTWQGNNEDYLNGQMYDDGYIYIWMQYFVSAGSLGYGWENFAPNN